MTKNPLAIFTGLALVALAAVVVVERDKWMGSPVAPPPPMAKAEPAPAVEPPKAEEPAKVAEPAKVEEPAKVAEAAKTDAPAEMKKSIPSFDTVRVETTGESIIAGQAEPGSEVTIKYNGSAIGTAVANADGAFVVTPEKPLPKGPGALSIEMKSKDTVVASADTVAVDVKEGAESTPMVAVLKPDQPTTVIQAPAETKPALPPMATVNLDSVDYDEQGNIVFSGRGPSGSKVQIYVDNNAYGLTAIGPEGTWTMPGGVPLTIGAHELRADEIGVDGTVTSRVAMPFYREDPAKVAQAQPAPVAPAVVAAAEPAPVVATTPDKSTTVVATVPATTTVEVAKVPEVATAIPAPTTAPAAAPAVTPPAAPAPAPAVAAATTPAAEPPKVEPAPAAAPAPAAPAPVAAAPAPVEVKPPAQVIIQPGNNLWKLSRKIYGKGIMYTVIFEANKDQIRKPGLIYPGQVFLTPDAPKTP